jgi:protocatechuate 3,4-dioxygenase beta subunit
MALRNRRQILKSLGGAAVFAGMGSGLGKRLLGQTCSITTSPALTEGPYFVDEILNRSDLTIDPTDNSVQPGMPLSLTINLKQLVNCGLIPLTGVYVDVWHCNATGIYSDQGAQNSTGKKFLRGYQATDRNGAVNFQTVYPGWYTGRAVHIHAKIRIFNGPDATYEFTTQFFFDEAVTDKVYQTAPYNLRPGRDTLNNMDGIYTGPSSLGSVQSNSGSLLLLKLNAAENAASGSIDLLLDESLGSSPSQAPGGPGGPGGPGIPPRG